MIIGRLGLNWNIFPGYRWKIHSIPAFCGCKIYEIGPLLIEWEYKKGCGNND